MPGTSEPRRRVACYVFLGSCSAPRLLVFEHVGMPQAGVQVPAGGVRTGESVEQAAEREVFEETGIRARVVRLLGTSDRPHPLTGEGRSTTYVEMRYDARAAAPPEPWTWRVTGDGDDQDMLFRCRFTELSRCGAQLAGGQDELLHLL